MDRRGFLLALAAGTLAAISGCDSEQRRTDRVGVGQPLKATSPLTTSAGPTVLDQPSRPPSAQPTQSPTSAIPPAPGPPSRTSPVATGPVATGPVATGPAPLPVYSVTPGSPPAEVQSLPGTGNDIALTIDDGTDSAVVKAYLDFVESSGVRLTFFVNGIRDSWTEHAAQLRPLVESGQVQLGNHTWSHPSITGLSSAQIVTELNKNEQFLNNTYGVSAKPFFRPPYGYHNKSTDKICADLGFSTITMWYGSFGDSSLLTPQQLLSLANQWLGIRRIVIGHANYPTVTTLYPQLLELIRERNLRTVTLHDAFYAS